MERAERIISYQRRKLTHFVYVIHVNSTQKHHLTHVIVIIIVILLPGKSRALISMIDSVLWFSGVRFYHGETHTHTRIDTNTN